jgi:calreticulin
MYIDDPSSTKPADWVDEEMMVDNDASEPEDWDEAKEGKWKPPMIKNPKYKGPWMAKKMYNPKYKGVWQPKMIPNPEYKEEALEPYTIGGVGFDVWQVKAGTLFDNIMIADSLEDAFAHAEHVLKNQVEKEKEYKAESDKEEEAKNAASRERLNEEMKNMKTDEPKEDL